MQQTSQRMDSEQSMTNAANNRRSEQLSNYNEWENIKPEYSGNTTKGRTRSQY